MLFRPLSLRLDDVRQSAPHANSSKSKQGVDRKRKSQSRERKRVIAPPDCPPPGAGTILAVFGNLRSLFSDPTAPPPRAQLLPCRSLAGNRAGHFSPRLHHADRSTPCVLSRFGKSDLTWMPRPKAAAWSPASTNVCWG